MRTTRRWSVIAFLAIAAIVAAMFSMGSASAAPATGYSTPVLTASAVCDGTSAVVTVGGDRFTPGATGVATYNSAPATSGTFTVGANGTFSASLTVVGTQGSTIRVNDSRAESATASFSVAKTCAAPTNVGGVTVSNPKPTAGESITVSGRNCTAGATITVTLDGTTVLGTTKAGADGSYSLVVKIPAGVSGKHTINVSGPGAGCSGVSPVDIGRTGTGGGGGGSGGGGGLASTGVAVIGLGSLGVVLLVGGGLMLLAGRRRRTNTSV